MRWTVDHAANLRVVDALQNTTALDADISPYCPPTAEAVLAFLSLRNTDNASTAYVSAVGDGLQSSGGSENAGQLAATVAPLSASRQELTGPVALIGGTRTLRHRQSGSGASRAVSIDVLGYWEGV